MLLAAGYSRNGAVWSSIETPNTDRIPACEAPSIRDEIRVLSDFAWTQVLVDLNDIILS